MSKALHEGQEAATSGLFDQYRRIALRRAVTVAALLLLAGLAFLLDITAGPAGLGFGDVISGILDPASLDRRTHVIIWDVRLPDALIALVVGAALSLAGVETQTTLNNPLASPFTLGISAAATLGAAFFIVVAPAVGGFGQTLLLPAFAFSFAMIAAAAILGFSGLHGGSSTTIVLYGIALVFLCEAMTAALQYVASAEVIQQIVFWNMGNLTRAGWPEVAVVASVLAVILPFSLRDVWRLTALRGGEDQARSAGLSVTRIRIIVMIRVAILSAVAVCFVGTIGFVGLVGPHIARMLLGEDHRFLVPGACCTGAALLSLASWLSKVIVPGAIVPVYIITAIIGVPVFLVLISWRRKETSWQ
ncbi:FecCD family ABC transporter permease [Roseibium aestuarii]|uniref:FecCD family ABC transporter permease n=1 Tax=Roseibium aestuarii TaxID=2600299 RepID=A0ABW4JWK6_9HYPH|nr:iron ABC transporter permease [Roseibium aestuarii]